MFSATLRMNQRSIGMLLSLAVLCVVRGPGLQAATLPGGFTETLIAQGLARPTAMAIAPDGRVFVCEQGGLLRVIKDDKLLDDEFLAVAVNSSGERGLLGVAFDPAFTTNHFVYIYYTTATSPIHNRVSRFTANGDVAVVGSEVPILDLEPLGATNHNGGAIHFGIDGKLYVAVGDNAVGSNAQTLNNRLGKLLRINRDGTIPTNNPFYNQATGPNRAIWALGLRNPFTFSVQRLSGRIFINDVGEVTWEEINEGVAGANYGWPITEGPTNDPRFRTPLYAYDRRNTGDCAITGGAFYDPIVERFPAPYVGLYFFADFCGGWIRTLNPQTETVSPFANGISLPVDLQLSDDGDLYYLARGNTGVLYRVNFATQAAGNLVVPTLTAPKGAASGATVQVTDKTSNTGDSDVAASETGIWLSTNKTFGGDTLLATRAVPSLAPGESSKGTSAVTLPAINPGTYFLIAQADTDDTVNEINENDNLKVKRLLVGPDLEGAIAAQPTITLSPASMTFTVRVTTTNVGFDRAGASTTRLYRSANGKIGTGDPILAEWAIPALDPTQSSVNSVTVTLPAGTHYLLAAVDAANAVMEAIETGNVAKVKVIVP